MTDVFFFFFFLLRIFFSTNPKCNGSVTDTHSNSSITLWLEDVAILFFVSIRLSFLAIISKRSYNSWKKLFVLLPQSFFLGLELVALRHKVQSHSHTCYPANSNTANTIALVLRRIRHTILTYKYCLLNEIPTCFSRTARMRSNLEDEILSTAHRKHWLDPWDHNIRPFTSAGTGLDHSNIDATAHPSEESAVSSCSSM